MIFVFGGLIGGPRCAHALEFSLVGARAIGMGGAGVAVTTDAFAGYWNPAGLAIVPSLDLRAQVSAHGIDRMGIRQIVREGDQLDGAQSLEEAQPGLQDLIDRFSRPGASASATGSAGLYLKTTLGNHAFGINVSDVAWGGGFFPVTDQTVVDSDGNFANNTQLATKIFEARQIAISYAYFFARTLAIGTTAKIIQGAAYSHQAPVFNQDASLDLSRNIGRAKLSTTASFDLGLIYRPASWLSLGLVAKDINQPSFATPDGTRLELGPQVRTGLALHPLDSLTLGFDADVLPNRTLIPSIKSQRLSLGGEWSLFSQSVFLRAGALKDVRDANSHLTPTMGFGLALQRFRFDLGGGYDFHGRQALASLSLGLTF